MLAIDRQTAGPNWLNFVKKFHGQRWALQLVANIFFELGTEIFA